MKHVHCEIAFFSLLWQQHPHKSKAFWTSRPLPQIFAPNFKHLLICVADVLSPSITYLWPVVYFDQLSGAARTRELVELLFFSNFQAFLFIFYIYSMTTIIVLVWSQYVLDVKPLVPYLSRLCQ